MSRATFYKWRAKYGAMDASVISRMKKLEAENQHLKKMYAEVQLKPEIIWRPCEKSSKAIWTPKDD